MNTYTTKVTWLGSEYGCRILCNGKPILEARCKHKKDIGNTCRCLLRTIDKYSCSDKFTHAARYRCFKPGNNYRDVKHIWLP